MNEPAPLAPGLNAGKGERAAMNSSEKVPPDMAPLTPDQLHALLVNTHVVGNNVRRKFIRALYAMHVNRYYLRLGFSGIAGYAEKYFGCQKATTYQYLSVAEALTRLPLCDEAFKRGELGWSALVQIARIATEATEAAWIEFARTHAAARLRELLRDAADAELVRCDCPGGTLRPRPPRARPETRRQ